MRLILDLFLNAIERDSIGKKKTNKLQSHRTTGLEISYKLTGNFYKKKKAKIINLRPFSRTPSNYPCNILVDGRQPFPDESFANRFRNAIIIQEGYTHTRRIKFE